MFSAFILLPFGVRTHDEAGLEMVPGQADSAPAEFRGGRLLLRAAVLAAFVTTAYVLNYIYGWITVNDIMFWGQTPEILFRMLLAILSFLLERGLLLQPTQPVSADSKYRRVGKSSPDSR